MEALEEMVQDATQTIIAAGIENELNEFSGPTFALRSVENGVLCGFATEGSPLVIGRLPSSTIVLPNRYISRVHAMVEVCAEGGSVLAELVAKCTRVRDQEGQISHNGDAVLDKDARVTLAIGDHIAFGPHKYSLVRCDYPDTSIVSAEAPVEIEGDEDVQEPMVITDKDKEDKQVPDETDSKEAEAMEALECCICMQPPAVTMIMSCGHHLCYKCSVELRRTNAESEIQCPTCRGVQKGQLARCFPMDTLAKAYAARTFSKDEFDTWQQEFDSSVQAYNSSNSNSKDRPDPQPASATTELTNIVQSDSSDDVDVVSNDFVRMEGNRYILSTTIDFASTNRVICHECHGHIDQGVVRATIWEDPPFAPPHFYHVTAGCLARAASYMMADRGWNGSSPVMLELNDGCRFELNDYLQRRLSVAVTSLRRASVHLGNSVYIETPAAWRRPIRSDSQRVPDFLTTQEIRRMRVNELKCECSLRRLATSGLKGDLVDRLIYRGRARDSQN